MAADLIIPVDLWDSDDEGVITNWFAGDSATVSEGALIAEVMVAKIQYELKAPAGGVLTIIGKVDDIVARGDLIGRIE